MKRSVLIIDDDLEFSQLLKGIYEQADYEVYTAESGDAALELIRKKPIQLVVTDQRLPGPLAGSDLLSKFREMEFKAPVIMVSGFLNDDTIRDLIRDGVEGVFIKPLNIFSLLKKSSAILDELEKAGQGTSATSPAGSGSSPTISIGHIEGLSEKGKRFLARAMEAASFKRNLLLIGPPGTLFDEIARDLVALSGGNERSLPLRPGHVTREGLEAFFEGEQGKRPLTLVLLAAEHLSEVEVDQLIAFADERGGSASSLRMIFCLGESVESLYDQGKIDEELYLFLGSNELRIPALKEMPEDLIAIARQEIHKQSTEAVFDMKLRSFLLDYDWPENMVELRSVVIRATSFAQPLAPTVRHFQAALTPGTPPPTEADSMRSSLERFLNEEKNRYLAARHLLHNA